MTLADFHFLRPLWLLALPALPAVIWILRRRASEGTPWRRVVDAALLPHVLARPASGSVRPLRWLRYVLLATYTLAVLALAGPAWQRLPQPVYQERSALVILLDLSRSMDAQDVKPSRLVRARFKIADLLEQRRAGMTALVVYAEEAYSVVPLTDDAATILSHLPVLEPGLMPAQGSRPERAVVLARELLAQGGMPRGDLLLLTDSLSSDQARQIAEDLDGYNYRLSILAMGTAAGAPIPRPGGGHFETDDGKPVLARLEPAPMQALVKTQHGRFLIAGNDDADVQALTRLFVTRINAQAGSGAEFTSDRWHEEGPWLILPLIPLAALLFRRGLVAAALIALLPWPRPASAWQWEDLWRRPDQQAAAALEEGHWRRAADLFEDPRWAAAARYRAEDYAGAVDSLQGLDNSDDHYNRGNGLVRLGKYKDAIAAYEQALTLDAGNDDARHNRDLLRQLLQQSANQRGGSGENTPQGAEQETSPPQAGDGQRSDGGKGQQQSESARGQGDAGNEPEQATANRDTDRQSAEKLEELLAQRERQSDGEQQDAGAQPERTDSGEPEVAGQSDAPQDPDQRREASQADEQWLRRIPDDPGGLLRRKFYYQYSQSNRTPSSDNPW
jgi:Ca-activated chloride channel family protein